MGWLARVCVCEAAGPKAAASARLGASHTHTAWSTILPRARRTRRTARSGTAARRSWRCANGRTRRARPLGTTHRMVSGSVSTMARAAARIAGGENRARRGRVAACAAHGKAARVVDEAVTALRLQAEKKRSAAKERAHGRRQRGAGKHGEFKRICTCHGAAMNCAPAARGGQRLMSYRAHAPWQAEKLCRAVGGPDRR